MPGYGGGGGRFFVGPGTSRPVSFSMNRGPIGHARAVHKVVELGAR